MSGYPPPRPGHGPPPPGYGSPHRGAPHANANGVLAAAVAAVVIVAGVVATVLLVTSDANTRAQAAVGSGSRSPSLPSGQRSRGSSVRLPSGSGYPTDGGPSDGDGSDGSGGSGADLAGATSTGTGYFRSLGSGLYYTSQGAWCDESQFPLSQDDVYSVTRAYAVSNASGTSTAATMQGQVNLDDGRSGLLTIGLRPESADGSSWCITSESDLS